ncbi:sialate O-acetylesterase [Polaribacter sp. PL03]|uniref:sialate O-acetylesterase n=1 Tax=Polaribacter sp. PL03 TaxID=3088353 RepID=UPI0029D16149|nr:sialate O-acetylesterase [Polaribacter sp. PL03]MDX6746956.1 sialate O-acetylesterase [Polaribacter sp. PL03]
MRNFIFLFCLIGFYSCSTSKIIAQEDKNAIQVVLLAGQSNMAGAGNYDELDDSIKERVEKVANRVFISQSNTKQKPLSYYKNKPSKKYDFTKRFGPELLIGLTLAEKYPQKEFLLIKHAKGGTALYGAWNPNWSLEKAKEIEKGDKKQSWNLVKQHIDLINQNLSILKEKGKSFKIIGLTWMQGENDAVLEKAANMYAENLEKLIKKYRTTFNEMYMPFVFGQINSRYGVKNGAETVRKQMEIASKKNKNTFLIKTNTDKSWSDYPKHLDNVHYNTEGQKRLGIAFANQLIIFLEQ